MSEITFNQYPQFFTATILHKQRRVKMVVNILIFLTQSKAPLRYCNGALIFIKLNKPITYGWFGYRLQLHNHSL